MTDDEDLWELWKTRSLVFQGVVGAASVRPQLRQLPQVDSGHACVSEPAVAAGPACRSNAERRLVVERRMAARRGLYQPSMKSKTALRASTGSECDAIEQLALERGEEALAQRVVVAVADRAHRGPHAGLAAAPPEGERGVLAALVGVMDHARRAGAASSAMSSAARTSSVRRCVAIAQPTTRRLQTSSTTAR